MRQTKAAIYLCTALLLAAAPGCGALGNGTAAPAGTETERRDSAKGTEKNHSKTTANTSGAEKNDSETTANTPGAEKSDSETKASTSRTEETISGNVKSIGDNSIVLSKAEDISDSEMATPAEGSPDEDLVTVRFSENTEFIVSTVKNGGVNGDSDVESRKGSFSDLKEQSSLSLTGSYDGKDFLASQVILYIFV